MQYFDWIVRLALSSLLCLLLAGCFVASGPDQSAVTLTLDLPRDQTPTARLSSGQIAGGEWVDGSRAKFELRVSADDMDSIVHQESLSSENPADSLVVTLEVDSGEARLFDAVLFVQDEPPLRTYRPVEPLSVNLDADEVRDLTLTLQRQPTGVLTVSATNASGDRLTLQDVETGFDLPAWDFMEEDGGTWMVEMDDLPLERDLLPVVLSADGQQQELPDYIFRLTAENPSFSFEIL